MTTKKQIIALGGGGFSQEPDNPLLDLYILAQSPAQKPKVCFLPTASNDAEGYIQKFHQFFTQYNCTPSHLSLSKPHTTDIAGFLLDQDIIYVGGGDPQFMMAVWQEQGVDKILKSAWDNGIILSGISAGAICWFEQFETYEDDLPPEDTKAVSGLGFLNGAASPHYDSQPELAKILPRLVADGQIKPCLAIDNSCAVHFMNGQIHACVSSIKDRTARMIMPGGAQPWLATRYLENSK